METQTKKTTDKKAKRKPGPPPNPNAKKRQRKTSIKRKPLGFTVKPEKTGPGRPTIFTKDTVDKFEMAFSIGCSDPEACIYAGVSLNAFYKWQKKNPDFISRKQLLKEKPVLMARKAVTDAITGNKDDGIPPDANIAFKYLERKRRHEFGINPPSAGSDESGSGAAGGLGARYSGIPARLVAPEFANFFRDVTAHRYTHFWEPGGRGATRSTSISLAVIDLLMTRTNIHALICRQVKGTIRDSVFAQTLWAVNELGLDGEFNVNRSNFFITREETGQNIYFRGLDDPFKIKSIKPPFGYIGIFWLEEADQAKGEEALRPVRQSFMRGGDEFWDFESWNTPRNKKHWINQRLIDMAGREDIRVHHSTYLNVPLEWLGQPFIDEAEDLKARNEKAYRHEYLGEDVGYGGQIFENLSLETLSDETIKTFDNIRMGLDWGFATDPLAWVKTHYDKTRKTLYIFEELCAIGLPDEKAAVILKSRGVSNRERIVCDSEDPKSIANFRSLGFNTAGCRKYKGSLEHGVKWLQDLELIVIDPVRCRTAANEFSDYEYKMDLNGDYLPVIVQKNDHTIDAVRYALDDEINQTRPTVAKSTYASSR